MDGQIDLFRGSLVANDADSKLYPDKQEYSKQGNTDCKPVGLVTRQSRAKLIGTADNEQHGAKDREVREVPIDFRGKLHRYPGQQ